MFHWRRKVIWVSNDMVSKLPFITERLQAFSFFLFTFKLYVGFHISRPWSKWCWWKADHASDSLTQHHSCIIIFRSVWHKHSQKRLLYPTAGLILFVWRSNRTWRRKKKSRMHVVAVKACLPAIYFCTDPICEQAPATRCLIPLEIQGQSFVWP